MKEALTEIEKDLCAVSSMLCITRHVDLDEYAIEIENCLELCEEMVNNARQKLTNELIMMK